ncbi:hypothetical protein AUEXF2481DRAFT_642274 [Aureobasidium subglaciale EXF-2481]|uniref:Glutamyl-tRNA amidotransferase complex subunit Gta3 domain-containing protein n=1 Tax=Aureobasidium subglaciale (strain EXF-2481) TaxID=1043005 RepID=A0A074YFK0_AURSE|nr:uncharacterized protein AUEXF2481DRAFT_642274 [Aureobasidium subglaciale EXF-2481]KAI5193655.1 hypothetical protein E4T38_09822 [Aureobasidium subglaciale]KAI5213338.1 hypothetical protein E4T40_09813 [Aureobasidium subglaciale]KAI5214724.1 hypothetical protein E4T41_09816 [Aureobasidium subglaciale]KAI5252741.1 hypothetical protein E4T46_09809 [Aureobasidium subglaciale]KEQ96525.1 hypothetical protein AUEXF2481DRAFT_642274 [Aureobasidium subglaciale EXF-2481]
MPPLPMRIKTSHLGSQCAKFHTTRRLLQSPTKIDVEALLARPTWSLESLLPPSTPAASTPIITSKQLHHLLRLSALPPPRDADEEAKMLSSLSKHLHFVNEIRKVDASHVTPLQSLRDETASGLKEQEISLDDLKIAFTKEQVRGEYYKRIRRNQDAAEEGESAKTWDVLAAANNKVGRYFVVNGGKDA